MSTNACYALPTDFLDIAVVEDSKPMQMILRSMLAGLQARRIRVFDNGPAALQAMVREPPNLVVCDLRMPGMSGLAMIRSMRAPSMDPLCFVPVIVVTAHATQSAVEDAMAAGAHLLLVKPVAPAAMIERVNWIINDRRPFVIGTAGHYVIQGVPETLAARRHRARAMKMVAAAESRSRRARAEAAAGLPPAKPPAASAGPSPAPSAVRAKG